MYLPTNIKRITRVLLADHSWYDVVDGSFEVGRFVWSDGVGSDSDAEFIEPVADPMDLPEAARFRSHELRGYVTVPIGSIIAVQHWVL